MPVSWGPISSRAWRVFPPRRIFLPRSATGTRWWKRTHSISPFPVRRDHRHPLCLRELQRKGAKVLGICNVVGSTIARESDGGTYIHSGPEIAVASTKAFTSQITVFYLFTLLMARMRHMSWDQGLEFINALNRYPTKWRKSLKGRSTFALWRRNTPMQKISFSGAWNQLSRCP